MPDASAVRVRIAPSPTGFAHLGTASTALYNLLFARHAGGVFVLRVDDTDLQRNRDEYEQVIYQALGWLGLQWDEGPDKGGPHGPYRQSERLELYREHADRLLERGSAYRCYCTAEELEAERQQAQRERRPYVYSRRCLKNPPEGRTRYAIRFAVPGVVVTFTDMIRGEMRFDSALFGDFIIVKSDGYPTYNFASPIDDAAMEITHVIRGEEHLSNTPYQLLVVDALGYERPRAFAHMPLILAADGGKLSKRKHPEANLMLYREQGYLPEAMVNYLALLGWNPGTEQELFSFAELVDVFSFDRVQHGGARFDRKKLDSIDGEYIRRLTDDELFERLRPFVQGVDDDVLRRAVPELKTRLVKLSDASAYLDYLAEDPAAPELDSASKGSLEVATDVLRDTDWEAPAIERALESAIAEKGLSKGSFYTPIRVAVTGRKVALPIHHTLALLPKAKAMERIQRALR